MKRAKRANLGMLGWWTNWKPGVNRNDAFGGECKIVTSARGDCRTGLRKLMRAARRGKLPEELVAKILLATEEGATRAAQDVYSNAAMRKRWQALDSGPAPVGGTIGYAFDPDPTDNQTRGF